MRTSHPQYNMMVEFMEKHGDLSKPSGGPRGKHYIQQKWKELTDMLNSDGTGDSRTEEKWQKVWSDYKNNTKKKWAIINRSAQGTGGGPALQLTFTDLENRVMNIIGAQAATGMPIQEAVFIQEHYTPEQLFCKKKHKLYVSTNAKLLLLIGGGEEDSLSGVHLQVPPTKIVDELTVDEVPEHSWNTPGTSRQPTVAPPSPAQPLVPTAASVDTHWTPPKKRKKTEDPILKVFKECEGTAREYERQRDRIAEELEREDSTA